MPVDCPLDQKGLEEVAETFGTPYQLYDERLIRENAKELVASFKKEFPDFQQFFAVKALPNPAILKVRFVFFARFASALS
jgi:diaminopimelate decarboxylase